ncbi:MAG: 23S rRNA (uracil(1939)-C(5))-methyltransferase RlmD [Bacteroidetes bacterium]|nr:MAG: 23S rRNA (uracil(1939)-C(5))-methyltransferase RlmD [Bacteroidota bacterium]
MGRKRKEIIPNVLVESIAAEGKALARVNGKVVFIEQTVPGDVVDVLVYKKKKNFSIAKPLKFHQFSEIRQEPFCKHFGICGGCKWQMLPYEKQLEFKQKQVTDQFQRIAKVSGFEILPIAGCEEIKYYRNKLEFTFTPNRWLTEDEIQSGETLSREGLGFHIPGRFDKILDIDTCYLQPEPGNKIRNFVKEKAKALQIPFFHPVLQEGVLRNIIFRNSNNGEWMLIFSFTELSEKTEVLMSSTQKAFLEITSIFYVVNQKKNDSITDLPVHKFYGQDFITETMGNLKFKISPKSFYQTNSRQAEKLYSITRDFADIQPEETVYDLYTGTGTIACYVAADACKVIGIEYVEDAVKDAYDNAALNGIKNVSFFAGDMKKVLNEEFISTHGSPDVLITDPPRAGMDKEVIETVLRALPDRIVYVSCNPATQARDVELLSSQYEVVKLQPVDMFPHTHHIENVVLLKRKD